MSERRTWGAKRYGGPGKTVSFTLTTRGAIENIQELDAAGTSIPQGGAEGQVLVKGSASDFDTRWATLQDLSLWFENQLL